MTRGGMLETDARSEREGMEGRRLEDGGGEPPRLAKDLGAGGLGPAAEAVVLIPSWQAEEKCEASVLKRPSVTVKCSVFPLSEAPTLRGALFEPGEKSH